MPPFPPPRRVPSTQFLLLPVNTTLADFAALDSTSYRASFRLISLILSRCLPRRRATPELDFVAQSRRPPSTGRHRPPWSLSIQTLRGNRLSLLLLLHLFGRKPKYRPMMPLNGRPGAAPTCRDRRAMPAASQPHRRARAAISRHVTRAFARCTLQTRHRMPMQHDNLDQAP
jgi:hypothetical protein